ncbi:hypothetical protein EDD64_11594 [Effusibacillus lacus]|nr:hypothetical protein EDD64_11594 [Effusibacillus lacus]
MDHHLGYEKHSSEGDNSGSGLSIRRSNTDDGMGS